MLASAAIIFQTTACGTILHPERRGQRAGRIDPAVAILDGLGLLLFIIPGVIAFAVDFNNGAIYLPGGSGKGPLEGKSLLNLNDPEKVRFDPKRNAKANVEGIIRAKTGLSIRLDQKELEISRLESIDGVSGRLAARTDVFIGPP